MEGHETGMPGNRIVQRRDIAVAHQWFGITAQQRIVEPFQQTHAAVATAKTDDGVDIGRRERRMQVRQAPRITSGQIALGFGDPGIDPAQVATCFKPLNGRERIKLGRPSWGDDGDTTVVRQCLGQFRAVCVQTGLMIAGKVHPDDSLYGHEPQRYDG
ncbi:hypothetical protein D3C78_912970 [compost metagenome]